MTAGQTSEIAARTRRKVAWRILPFVFLLYIIAYLDRANVAFVNVPMSADLGFSEAVFGFGAGIFFLGYFLLEIPGALIVERWSARRWLARIMVTWGIFTALVGFVHTPSQFYSARFLLGVAEAGFFPGVIVYLTHWFIQRDRARAMSGFITAAPVALAIGAPLSGLILQIRWLDWPGWRWVFVLEGVPAVLFGFVTVFYLTDRPAQAGWLRPEERLWLIGELEREKEAKKTGAGIPWWRALRRKDVLLLTSAYFFANVAGYGFILWLPAILKRVLGLPVVLAAVFSALPFVVAVLAIWLVSRSSDRTGERKRHACLSFTAAALFLGLAAIPGLPFPVAAVFICLTGAAAYAWISPFWVLPTLTLGESAAAASIGLINSVGNLGGFVGPAITGLLLSRGLPHGAAMAVLSLSYFMSALLTSLVQVGQPRDRCS